MATPFQEIPIAIENPSSETFKRLYEMGYKDLFSEGFHYLMVHHCYMLGTDKLPDNVINCGDDVNLFFHKIFSYGRIL